MGRPCKVCSSSISEEVDRQILDGVSFSNLEKYCVARGLRVSAKSIAEHAKHHVKEYRAHSERGYNYTPSDTPRNQTASETILRPFVIKRIPYKDTDRLIATAKRSLCEILLNPLAIVRTKQQQFMEGECGYPNDELRGLKTVIECFQVVTGTEKSKRAGQHIFDVDSALESVSSVELDELLTEINLQ